MGIQGLTSFINNRSDRYLEYYELYDTYLVIDGNSIACQLYSWHSKCNCVFGGDYDKFAECISKFFDDLLKCNITPLVLIDGGSEDKKLYTIISRTKDKIRTAATLLPVNQKTQRMKFFPLLMKEVFKDVMRKKNIRHVQCLFEADNAIAAVARTLNCPVLSYDSDFYIYGTMYIPFDTMDSQLFQRPNGKGYMKCCKIYRVIHLLKSFRGLKESMLPLAAILLGNDYVKYGTFKNFFQHVKLRGFSRKKHNQQQCRIEAVFIWLSKQTLDKAVVAILSRVRKQIRPKLLNIIETNINGYTNSSIEILIPLGFSRDYVAQAKSQSVNTTFKFNGDLNSLSYIEETCEGENEEEEAEGSTVIKDILEESEYVSENALVKRLPTWFVNEFLEGRYPAYFMDLLVRCLYICPVQIEDYSYPSSIVMSVEIISVIYGLLKAGISGRVRPMKYMIRGDNKKLMCCKLDGMDAIHPCKLPSLFSLRQISLIRRKEIINNTLGLVNNECMNELPPNWMLYIACVKYWIEKQELREWHKCYMYSVFICMLFNIVDYKIGMYRTTRHYENQRGTMMQVIQVRRKADKFNPSYPMNVTVLQAYNEIDSDDCLLAAPFFVSHFETDQKLLSNPKKFNRSIVHAFAELQNCLRHSMNLNALLDYPYPQVEIANLFNGTLLYNLCSNLKSRHNIEAYISTVFQNAPTLLRLFQILLRKVTPLFPSVFEDDNNVKKPRKKSKRVKSDVNAVESDTEYFSPDDSLQEAKFYDVNNPFSLLNST